MAYRFIVKLFTRCRVFLLLLIKIFKKLSISSHNHEQKLSLLVYPKITDEDSFLEIINKICWAYPSSLNLNIMVYAAEKLPKNDELKLREVPYQRSYISKQISNIKFVSNIKNLKYDYLLLHDFKSLIYKVKDLYKVEILDKNFYSTSESVFLQNAYFKTLNQVEKNSLRLSSKNNFSRLLHEKSKFNQSTCFVTGPSFSFYKKIDFNPNGLKIICNSIVKNKEFLEYIEGPDILVFADPVFHFSSNEYSATFRDHTLEVVDKYNPYVIVPESSVPLLISHYPKLSNKIIGIETKKGPFNIPGIDKLWVKSTKNILTLLMLPIAARLSKQINIIGADGREKKEKYFWKHSKDSQFHDLMPSAFNCHPSFFRDRNYNDYYNEHCKVLKDQIDYIESQGKKINSLTESYIPVLKKRYVQNRL